MNENRDNATSVVIERLKSKPEVFSKSYVVGRWVWIEFDTKPDEIIRGFLKVEGFKWNAKRKVWQHPCGIHSTGAPYDPRIKYVVYKPQDELQGVAS